MINNSNNDKNCNNINNNNNDNNKPNSNNNNRSNNYNSNNNHNNNNNNHHHHDNNNNNNAASSTDTPIELLLHRLVHEHCLTQLAQQPTCESALLDLIFMSSSLELSQVVHLPLIAGCNHSAQQLLIYSNLENVKSKQRNVVNYEHLVSLLSQIV